MVSIFAWWKGVPLGTLLTTRRKGRLVGRDDQGNTYYQSRDGKRRWVLYDGENEASRVPPEWHMWLHKTTDTPPSERPPERKTWEKDHLPNLTGTSGAYFPPGSLSVGGERGKISGDYEAWTPDS
ncbi:NADH:ubiquinone oxidoreductase subunit [Rhodothalassium salexigens DSM 2132]|mgnify:CR=1 FL=1|uniref:NADH:ubiquinone oxidoreductase subunit n=1 Tax=Rhodothalassium salexigens DSM 2132 TaxID=1188247 RepID=A0A4R2PQF0_RHOSA|nr:NADH:ubiquinone oxidoreductase subunit NDUFA12 [Rhodothalassium salexigens]MBB4210526.1 NADH:ubiquinone oxidoreductase subunit [Rhodothalassium salexigens DSM 2132]MBK1638063.1 NADH:ubiquinone oxidoreductase subunit NDUFA12 [Rhodothalassium salexigens DSM 2132]TCP37917.1 NADH:ubiquinone oxidoreductase subunit [Rhodothalassium salexigens DSM 2132]